MTQDVIDRDDWAPFFIRVSSVLTGQRAEVEVASLALGQQIAAEWTPVLGVSYDHKDDLVSLALSGLDHLIRRPETLAAKWKGPRLESLAITDREGAQHLLRFREPLMLPPIQCAAGER